MEAKKIHIKHVLIGWILDDFEGASHLADGNDEEGPSSAGFDDNGDEFGVDRTEAGVPRHAGHPHVVDAVLGFPRLGKDVAELALPDDTAPERHVCGGGTRTRCVSHVAHPAENIWESELFCKVGLSIHFEYSCHLKLRAVLFSKSFSLGTRQYCVTFFIFTSNNKQTKTKLLP